jgi:two-component system, NarL family, nitrate/nitrite response regulator NarL
MTKKIRIGLLDDHQIVIDGLKILLQNNQEFDVVMDCNQSPNIIAKIEETIIDVLLTDVMMPDMDGYAVALEVRKKFPDIKIIVLTMNSSGETIQKMIEEAKIDGYLLKTCTQDQLYRAIEIVYNGGQYFEDNIWDELDSFNEIQKTKEAIHFTPREIEIVGYLAQGKSNKQIAEELIISEHTVDTHRKNIYRKSDTHTVVGLLEFARNHHFLT